VLFKEKIMAMKIVAVIYIIILGVFAFLVWKDIKEGE
jgi:hypothetical protein